ncbi:hypothetical protein [Halorussus pelagicus]|uniref:hypothetical protein n=1 Tax=Halorussus pelagicus TaxID=2505977 RepID=UPI000FFC6CF9|nr:hypothetical protein [Halorussus pelagicus]
MRDFIQSRKSANRELIAVNADTDDERVAEIRRYFERYDVALSSFRDETLPDRFLLLTEGERCLAAIDVDTLYDYLIETLNSGSFAHRSADDPELFHAIQAFLTNLDGTVYTVEREGKIPLVGISRVIEQRAGRTKGGTIHTGVQRLSRLRDERETWETYVRLADRGTDVNLYGVPDWRPPATDSMTVFADEDGGTVGDLWFVVSQGEDSDAASALVAQEVEAETYTGFWTFDPEYVGEIAAYVENELRPDLTRLRDE